MSQESVYVPGETYTSVRATPELVGREKELEQIEEAIRDTENSYIVYVTGQGGIGKTRLVKHVLEHPPDDVSLVVASDLIDLYHTSTHTVEGLIDTVQRALSPDGKGFECYQEEREKLSAYTIRPPDKVEKLRQQREAMINAFQTSFNGLAEQHRIVLALDTAEKLFLQEDLAAQRLGLIKERSAIIDWLISDFLPHTHNTVALLAGRPGPGNLKQDLAQIQDHQFLSINLPGLTEDEALGYFEAVIKSAVDSSDPKNVHSVEAIQELSTKDRRVIFHCLCDEGDLPTIRPILLALTIDYMVVAGQPLSALTQPLESAKALSAKQRRALREKLGSELIQTIHEYRRPADELIIALGWLRKGADSDILSRITGLDPKDIKPALNDIRDLSFVKIRPADNRTFLHDEMYDMIQQYTLDRVSDAERERVFKTLQTYYNERIEQARKKIADLYQPLTVSSLPDPAQVAAARACLQDALVEDLHYRLRWDTAIGFQVYFHYAEEAIAAADESLDVQLRAELLSFLSEHDPSGQSEEIDNLRRVDVVADAAVRWVKRLINDGRYDRALKAVTSLHTDAKDLIEGGGELAKAELHSWEALALLYSGHSGAYEKAQQLLEQAKKRLKEMRVEPVQTYRWSAILARTHNNLGYLRRVLGQFKNAAKAYRSALDLWGYVEIEADRANTFNNLAFALALIGEFDEAEESAEKALHIRERLGPRAPKALTYNTLAEIQTYAGRYKEAEKYVGKALSISQRLQFRRGEGLALLASAAIHRFQSESSDMPTRERKRLLRKALSESDSALTIFSKQVKEPERKARAYYESGVTCRELSRVSESDEEKEKYTHDAEGNLKDARYLARENKLWWAYMDASMGLAWMYYYDRATEKLEEILHELDEDSQQRFADYVITSGKVPVEKDTLIFGQFARLHVLRGMQKMDGFEQSDMQPPYSHLCEAAQEFTLALEYNGLVSKSHQGYQRSMHNIRKRLKVLDSHNDQQKVFYDAVDEVANKKLGCSGEECHLWHELRNDDELKNIFNKPYEVLIRLVQ